MVAPSIYEDFDSEWWGDAEVMDDIKDAEEARLVAENAMKVMKLETAWNMVTKKKRKETPKEAPKEAKSKDNAEMYYGVVHNIIKSGCGFIKAVNTLPKDFIFTDTSKFKLGDKVSFYISKQKSQKKTQRAVRIKLIK